jgi:hypothetical protein
MTAADASHRPQLKALSATTVTAVLPVHFYPALRGLAALGRLVELAARLGLVCLARA